jgi:uncharacterized phage protein (TIGR01671 family)
MRQIKFRAWDESRKKMYSGDPKWVDFKIESSGELTASNYNPKHELQMLPVMQFTGLKDANGVEICEGDICVWYINNLERLGEVYYHDQSFEMRSPSLGYIGWDANRGEVKVIGNIYQNLELLK